MNTEFIIKKFEKMFSVPAIVKMKGNKTELGNMVLAKILMPAKI